jgi:Flp pilus assembly protein TadG
MIRNIRQQHGQSVVIFALMAVALFGLAAIAVDLGLAQTDRRDIQAYADSAALAGTRQYALSPDSNYAHFVATQYLAQALGQIFPSGTCSKTVCGSSQTMGAYTITLTDSAIAAGETLDVAVSHVRPSLLAGILGFRSVTTGTSGRAIGPGPTTVSAIYNVAGLGSTGVYIDGGGTCAPSGDVTGNVYSNGPFGSTSNGHCHPTQVPTFLSGTGSPPVQCPGPVNTRVDFGPSGSSQSWLFNPTPGINPGTPTATNVPRPTGFDAIPPTPPTDPTTGAPLLYTSLAQAKSGGHFNPGTYDGVVPNASATLNGGVYKIINVASPDISNAAQPAGTPQGSPTAANPAGSAAAVFVFDSTDSGDITINSLKLNGYDGPGDPAGTHNFVLYGGPSNINDPGKGGFQGNIHILGPADSPDLTGIIYLPNSGVSSNGNSPYTFYGAVYMDTFNLKGGGNGGQGFTFICGLNAISNTPPPGTLIR